MGRGGIGTGSRGDLRFGFIAALPLQIAQLAGLFRARRAFTESRRAKGIGAESVTWDSPTSPDRARRLSTVVRAVMASNSNVGGNVVSANDSWSIRARAGAD